MPSKRKRGGVVGAVLAVGVLSAAGAQAQKDPDYGTAPAPIEVNTNPVPQKTDPLPQGPQPGATAKKKAPPAPTTPPPPPPPPADNTTTSGGSSSGSSAGTSTGGGDTTPKTFNNEGTFKISGSKGPGTVGTAPAGKGTPKAKGTKVAAKPKADVPIAEWPGFRMTDDGGSEVMVEFSKALAAPTEHKAAGTITYVFPGAVVTKHNNKNPLLTIHFNTPVLDARLVTVKGELHLVVQLRGGIDVAAVTGMRPATEGTKQQFFVKFPSGSYLPATDDLDIKPNAKSEQGKASEDTTPKKKQPKTTAGPGADTGAQKGPTP